MNNEKNQIKDMFKKDNYKQIDKIFREMSDERLRAIDEVFEKASFEKVPMRQMSFGGEYNFYSNRQQVYLEGEFSKDDLLRIALVMK